MPIDPGGVADTTMHDHLTGMKRIDAKGFTDVLAPKKSRRQEYLDQGYSVIYENDDEDTILVGKKTKKEKSNGQETS